MGDEADEVRVFRRHEDEETEGPSLADDKRDVALEEELETKAFHVGKGGAFSQPLPSPSFPLFSYSPSYPAFPIISPFMMSQAAVVNMAAAAAAYNIQRLSPAFPAMLSPTYDMCRLMVAASSPIAGGKSSLGSIPLPSSMRSTPLNPIQMMNQMGMNGSNGASTSSHSLSHSMKKKREKEEHIKVETRNNSYVKKPMNAFMWFMKENRPKLMEEPEFKEKQSAELNKELGKRWQILAKDEQNKYYELAKKDKEDHLKKYPNWSARENYASNKKKKKKRDRTIESGESKKCRARFGMAAQDKWCKHCTRKKKCLYTGGMDEDNERGSSHSAHQRPSDSESDLDDDTTPLGQLTREMRAADSIKMEIA